METFQGKGGQLHEAIPVCWWVWMKLAFIFYRDQDIGVPCLLIILFLKSGFLIFEKDISCLL